MKSLFNHLVNAVLILVVLFFFLIVLTSWLFHTRVAVVLSGSMEPALPVGALALNVPVEPEEIVEGDIIAFSLKKDPKTTTSHRVVEVIKEDGLFFRTKGDANEDVDPDLVPASAVSSKVIFHVPRLGTLFLDTLDYVQSWPGFTILVVLPSLIVITNTIRGARKQHSLRQRRLEVLARQRRRWKIPSR